MLGPLASWTFYWDRHDEGTELPVHVVCERRLRGELRQWKRRRSSQTSNFFEEFNSNSIQFYSILFIFIHKIKQ